VKTVWGDFEVDHDTILGQGGMSIVFAGTQVSLKRPVAIKVLKRHLIGDEHDFGARFGKEAELIAKLVHPNVVQVFGAGQEGDQFFYAMERIEGDDLQKKIKEGEPFSENDILKVAECVANALAAAWKHKIVHRDIKPGNILVTGDGEIKVMDFGLAKHLEADKEKSSLVMGTPKYISPEQAVGDDCDVRTDIYSLGVVLYELCVGNSPFDGDEPQMLIYKHLHENPIPPRKYRPELSEPLEMLVLRCMEKHPGKRYQTPEELLQDIDRIRTRQKVSGRTISVVRKAAAEKQRPRKSRRAALLAALLLIACGVAIGVRWNDIQGLLGVQPPPGPTPGPGPGPGPGPIVGDAAFEEWKAKGDLAYYNSKWKEAIRAYETALEHLEEGDDRKRSLEKKITEAWREDTDAQAKAAHEARDYPTEIMLLKELLNVFERDQVYQVRLKEAQYRYGRQEAENLELDLQWAKALKKYVEIRPMTSEPGLVESRIEFCSAMNDAKLALDKGDAARAREFLKKALTYNRFQEAIRPLMEQAKGILSEESAEEMKKRRRKLQLAMARGFEHADCGRWKEALAQLEIAAELAPDDYIIQRRLREVRQAATGPDGMVYVPAGEFMMGTGDGQAEASPAHRVKTGAFYIDICEVTQREYARFLAAKKDHSGCHENEPPGKDHTPMFWESQTDPRAPVYGVDWYDAWAFAAWRGKRLPTEAEFEKAAGYDGVSGKSRRYPWGTAFRKTGDVSPWGVRGMGSGLCEWTGDEFRKYPGSQAESIFFSPRFKAVRGGVTLKEAEKIQARVSYRRPFEPLNRGLKLGFRCVKDVR
jgi:formylglycine-generating enzyme required for sulfatase activity/predicted Ser/Thr protein kinase